MIACSLRPLRVMAGTLMPPPVPSRSGNLLLAQLIKLRVSRDGQDTLPLVADDLRNGRCNCGPSADGEVRPRHELEAGAGQGPRQRQVAAGKGSANERAGVAQQLSRTERLGRGDFVGLQRAVVDAEFVQ